MIAARHHLAGEQVLLDPTGLLFWPREALLAVADLHFEKASAAARRGSLLPPWDSRVTLDRLHAAAERYRARTIVAVGDSFHDVDGARRMAAPDRARLAAIADDRRMVWIAGNHDPHPHPDPGHAVPGEARAELRVGPVLFRHEARPHLPPPRGVIEVCGHHHPKACVPTRGGGVSRPCFVACADGVRLMLPAFGAYTGGLDVGDPAIRRLFPSGGRVFLTGADRVFGFGLAALERL